MAVGTKGFQGERLTQAREARSLTVIALADLVGMSAASITQYEKSNQNPRPQVVEALADKLNLPTSFFQNPVIKRPEPTIFYRSMSSATKMARSRAENRYEWFREITDYLSSYFDFPHLNLPDLDVPVNFKDITGLQIESLAEQVRGEWNLGASPVGNMIRTLEANGILVSRGSIGADTLDAFSEMDANKQPYVFLASDFNVLARSRFSAAHELGHLILHQNVDKKSIRKAADFRLIENQAHHFAGAFLLPAQSFTSELAGFSLDSFRVLKGRWKVSIAAMIKRCEHLGLLSDMQVKRMWINITRRGWRRVEPLDESPDEIPQMISRSFELLLEHGIRTKSQILDDLRLSANDVEELACLESGFFDEDIASEIAPALKVSSEKVVRFRRS